MLINEKIKAWAPNVYCYLIKVMDSHYSVGSKANNAQHYQNHEIKTNTITNLTTEVMYM